jgi:hypothetical protein
LGLLPVRLLTPDAAPVTLVLPQNEERDATPPKIGFAIRTGEAGNREPVGKMFPLYVCQEYEMKIYTNAYEDSQ